MPGLEFQCFQLEAFSEVECLNRKHWLKSNIQMETPFATQSGRQLQKDFGWLDLVYYVVRFISTKVWGWGLTIFRIDRKRKNIYIWHDYNCSISMYLLHLLKPYFISQGDNDIEAALSDNMNYFIPTITLPLQKVCMKTHPGEILLCNKASDENGQS